jgi:hypothetical protein
MGLVLALVSSCLAPALASSWKVYKSAAGRFSVSLPGDPLTMKMPLKVRDVKLDLHMVATKGPDQAFYSVSYCDLPASVMSASEPKTVVDRFVHGMLQKLNGEVLSSREIKLGSIPGMEFTVRQSGGKAALCRVYYTSYRMYQAILQLDPGQPVPSDFDKFFNSLKITPR